MHINNEYKELQALESFDQQDSPSPRPMKRKRLFTEGSGSAVNSPFKTLPDMGVLAIEPKFRPDSLLQQDRVN